MDKYITKLEANGSVSISEDVICNLVISAINDVEGVAGLANTAGAELAELIGLKTIPKGVKVQFSDDRIIIDAIINVYYGKNIVNIAQNVQDSILSVILSSTGFVDPEINVHVSGISFEK